MTHQQHVIGGSRSQYNLPGLVPVHAPETFTREETYKDVEDDDEVKIESDNEDIPIVNEDEVAKLQFKHFNQATGNKLTSKGCESQWIKEGKSYVIPY